MNSNTDPASGAASAHWYNLTPSMTIFKTRIQWCWIAVRADNEKCGQLTENRRRLCGLRTSFVDGHRGVPMISRDFVRFTAHWQLKTDDSQRRCGLLFPYGTGRSNSNGLLEQMLFETLRFEWLASPQAHSAQPRSLLHALRPHSRSQSLISWFDGRLGLAGCDIDRWT